MDQQSNPKNRSAETEPLANHENDAAADGTPNGGLNLLDVCQPAPLKPTAQEASVRLADTPITQAPGSASETMALPLSNGKIAIFYNAEKVKDIPDPDIDNIDTETSKALPRRRAESEMEGMSEEEREEAAYQLLESVGVEGSLFDPCKRTLEKINLPQDIIDHSCDPAAAASGEHVYVGAVGLWPQHNLKIAVSPDQGKTWDTKIFDIPADKEWIAARDKDVYMTYTYMAPGDRKDERDPRDGQIFMLRSDDNGKTWKDPVQLSSSDRGEAQGSNVSVGPDGKLYTFWWENTDKGGVLKMRTSADHGQTFDQESVVAKLDNTATGGSLDVKGVRTRSFPQVAIAPDSGTVFLTYNDKDTNGQTVIYEQHSRDGGKSWSERAKLSSDDSINQQWMPTIAAGADGALSVAWYKGHDDDIRRVARVGKVDGGKLSLGQEFYLDAAPSEKATKETFGVRGDYDQSLYLNGRFYIMGTEAHKGADGKASQQVYMSEVELAPPQADK